MSIGTISLRPFLLPLSLRCTRPRAVSTPVTTTAWLASGSPSLFLSLTGSRQMIWALTPAMTLRPLARACSSDSNPVGRPVFSALLLLVLTAWMP
ncbi:Uncharacterised protein [Mycobacterium tuberculosis]|nr:Uncharacterised protein [Mycobacterium tuberculosis]